MVGALNDPKLREFSIQLRMADLFPAGDDRIC